MKNTCLVNIHGMLNGSFNLKFIYQTQQGCNVIYFVNMGPQANFAGKQILQHFIFSSESDFLFFPAPGLAVFLHLLAHFGQPAT